MLKSICMFFVSAIVFVSSVIGVDLGFGRNPSRTKSVDMSKFSLVWSDEFDGDTLDDSKWNDNQSVDTLHWGAVRRGGYWHGDMTNLRDGELIISTEYKDNPTYGGNYGKGYYTGFVTTYNSKPEIAEEPDTFLYGYFEARCKLPASEGLWSAFWMMNGGVYNIDGSGEDGTEIDIFEGFGYKDRNLYKGNLVSMNLHCDGYNEAHMYKHVGSFVAQNDLYNDYNTFGLEWNENEYIFYINGKECGRSDWGGVSKHPECLILSVEISGDNGVPSGNGDITTNEKWPAEFAVDYVRVYQYNSILNG